MNDSSTITPELFQDHSPETGHVEAGDQLAARQVALDIVHKTLQQKQALDHVVEGHNDFLSLPARDKAFCRMLSATVIRRLGQIDDLLEKAANRPSRISPIIHNILRLGCAQIMFMVVADHAAVDTSVRLAHAAGMVKQKAFVNAMLRTITRDGREWLAKQDETRLNTPEWLLKIWIADYGLGTAAQIAKANLTEAPLDLSIRNKAEAHHWQSTLEASPIGAASLRRVSGGNVSELEGFHDGRWWVQDASAAFPAYLFGDLNGRNIVDLCAAPGGKTMQLAAQGAQVLALDRSAKRLEKLKDNAERLNLSEPITIEVMDAQSWTPRNKAEFILLDAPCSATGTARRNPDVVHQKTPKDLEHLTRVQQDLLQRAFDQLATGGVLVYCTCSLQKCEGEEQIKTLLERNHNASKIAITAQEIGGLKECLDDQGDVRILPFHQAARGGMDGFFISRITKN